MKGHSPYWAKIEDMRAIKGNGWRRGIGSYKGRKDAIKE